MSTYVRQLSCQMLQGLRYRDVNCLRGPGKRFPSGLVFSLSGKNFPSGGYQPRSASAGLPPGTAFFTDPLHLFAKVCLPPVPRDRRIVLSTVTSSPPVNLGGSAEDKGRRRRQRGNRDPDWVLWCGSHGLVRPPVFRNPRYFPPRGGVPLYDGTSVFAPDTKNDTLPR